MEDEDEFPEVVNSLAPLLIERDLSSVAKSLGKGSEWRLIQLLRCFMFWTTF
jgi:hypothetical protein